MKKSFIIYHEWIPKVGGIETAVYNLAKAMSDKYNVTVALKDAENNETIFKYSEVANVFRIGYEDIECDTLLMASNHKIPKSIKYKRVGQWIHSDYEKYKLELANDPDQINFYVSVSQHAANVANKLFGIECTVIQNILDDDFHRPDLSKVLRLVTTSRISPEKGFTRMLTMAVDLRQMGVEFQWMVYGDNSHDAGYETKIKAMFKNEPNVVFAGYRRDIRYALAQADYLVQLSDFEGCPYSVLEALKFQVPCILTNFPSAYELIKDGKNGYIVSMDMHNIDYKKIVTKIPKHFIFDQSQVKPQWEKLI